MIIVTGTATASRETLAEMIRISLEHVRRSRTEEGCISHNVHIDCENPMRLMFFEQWADEETLRKHFALPESRKFARLLRELAVPATDIPDRVPDRMDVYDATKVRV
ncbi:MAG: putative quinol monooxygenase [Rhizomicrobium sp.]|jgi:quinol monooxygenase YgiN